MSNKHERFKWIMEKVTELKHVDILNASFVDEYVEKFSPTCRETFWGAPKVPLLSKDLLDLKKVGYLRRARIGLGGGNWQPGFPTWVWAYSLGENAEFFVP